MKATISKSMVFNAKQPQGKAVVNSWHVLAFNGEEFHEPVTVRCYMGRSANPLHIVEG